MAAGKGVSVKSAGSATVKKGAIETVFKDAIASRSGLGSPAPVSKNK